MNLWLNPRVVAATEVSDFDLRDLRSREEQLAKRARWESHVQAPRLFLHSPPVSSFLGATLPMKGREVLSPRHG